MKKLLIAMALLALVAPPSLAVEQPMADPATNKAADCQGGMPHHEMNKEMMRNPQHLLMMAYHKNFITFGRTLARVARQGDTVPPQFARTVIAEMRRSSDEMETYRTAAMSQVKPDPQMQKMMDEHLVKMNRELKALEELARKDRIPSAEVLKHLEFLSQSGQECQLQGSGKHGGEGKGGCGCGMSGHHEAMAKMTQTMKAQDQELSKKLETMKRAPRDKKVNLLADIVAQLVKQRAEMTAHLERMQKMHHECGHQDGRHHCAMQHEMQHGDMHHEKATAATAPTQQEIDDENAGEDGDDSQVEY